MVLLFNKKVVMRSLEWQHSDIAIIVVLYLIEAAGLSSVYVHQ